MKIWIFNSIAGLSGPGIRCGEPVTTGSAKTAYIRTGDSVINATFDTLRNALTAAMRDKGAEAGAVVATKGLFNYLPYASQNIIIKRNA